MTSVVVAKELDKKKNNSAKGIQEKPEIEGTFEIRINSNADKTFLYNYIYKYKHWQNIITILVTDLFKKNDSDYKYFLDYEIVRACISDTLGSIKKQTKIQYIKNKYQDNELYKQLLEVGQELKNHNLVMVLRRFKKDFSNYFKSLKDYKKNPHKYTGQPQMPRARKLSELTHYSIPLDSGAWSTKKNLIGINLKNKMRYFYIGKIIKNEKVLDKTIQSVSIKMRNSEIYLSFSYILVKKDKSEMINKPLNIGSIGSNHAGIDIGLNNLISLVIDDKESQSLIVDGAKYKHYNSCFNRFIAKLNNSISDEVMEYKTIIQKDKTQIQIPTKWTKRGHRLKRYISFLYRKRNDFFETEFHKISKRVVEYLKLNGVKQLVLSKNIAQLMNNGECNLRKKTKQNFIQIPMIQLIHYIEEKAIKNEIEVIFIDESYTSKTSCISGDVLAVQTKSKNGQKPTANEFKGTRAKRGLFKDSVLNKIWNADLNGAVNHIKIAFNSCFKWLKDALFKLCNPKVIKSANEFLLFNRTLQRKVNSTFC